MQDNAARRISAPWWNDIEIWDKDAKRTWDNMNKLGNIIIA